MKNLIIVLLFTCMQVMQSQNAVGFSASLDNKLTFLEDNHGNMPFTLDLSTKMSLQGYQKKLGYLQIAIKYEYADLSSGDFHRYAAEVGYVFTNGALGLMPSVGYGFIGRENRGSTQSWEFGIMPSFLIIPNLKLIVGFVWTERTDLLGQYRFNINTGLQFDIALKDYR